MTVKKDNEIIQIILPIIQNGLIENNFLNVTVKQSNQPTQQGIPKTPTVYFYKSSSKRFGYLGRYDKWVIDHMDHHEVQYMEITFVIQALVLQYPQTPNQYTASDLVNEVASIMQSDKTLSILNGNGIGILRVQEITNPYFTDDRDQFEASPSFEFTLVYKDDRLTSSPTVDEYKFNLSTI